MSKVRSDEHWQWSGDPAPVDMPAWASEMRQNRQLWLATDPDLPDQLGDNGQPLFPRSMKRIMQTGDHLIHFPFQIIADADFASKYDEIIAVAG